MKGIILAGGSGTRLHPITKVVNKHLIPVYNKPMIYYPLGTLIEGGITDILIITTGKDLPLFEELLGNGSQIGCKIQYKIQAKPNGLAEAFIIGEDFIGNDNVVLILGDNLFISASSKQVLNEEMYNNVSGAKIFAYKVKDPERFGVVEFEETKVLSLEEKPSNPRSNYAVPGIYIYNNDVIEIAKNVRPSDRGELEITSVNQYYLEKSKLLVQEIDNEVLWLDTGTFQSLHKANLEIKNLENKNIGCIEKIALRKGLISNEQFNTLISPLTKSGYIK